MQGRQRLGAAGAPRAQQRSGQWWHPRGDHAQGSGAADSRHLDGCDRCLPAVRISGLPCRLRRAWGIPGTAPDTKISSVSRSILGLASPPSKAINAITDCADVPWTFIVICSLELHIHAGVERYYYTIT